jgi:DNA processing protein
VTSGDAHGDDRAACASCVRRSWLLAQLGGPLDCNCRADGRLIDLLALADDELTKALAGRRLSELRTQLARFDASALARGDGIAEICRHDRRYPQGLRALGVPPMLFAAGELRQLVQLTTAPVVAIVGTGMATDYGLEIAGDLARGLAASGVTVAGELADGIARAALIGALEGGGGVGAGRRRGRRRAGAQPLAAC